MNGTRTPGGNMNGHGIMNGTRTPGGNTNMMPLSSDCQWCRGAIHNPAVHHMDDHGFNEP
jgi:hypothetical protein